MLFEPYSNIYAILAPNAYLYGSSSGSVVNKLPATQELQETRVQSLGQEDPLEWVAIPFSRGSSRPRDGTWVSHIGD